MPCQLPDDCLNEIFEYLEEDKIALHSCLLVNRRWCKISVRILWRNIWRHLKYSAPYYDHPYPYYQSKSILSTLIACLPNESIVLLYKNGIFISTPTSKPPLFNYASFCKVLSIYEIYRIINNALQSITSLNLKGKHTLVTKEIIKMFMNQISSLKKLICLPFSIHNYPNISFIHFPGASGCLAGLSELRCSSSKVYSEFFYQLSQVCHNLQSLSIKFQDEISNELEELISLQNNLNNLYLFVCESNWRKIIPALEKHANSLTKLHLYHIYSSDHSLPLSFIALFSNLQEIKLSFNNKTNFEDFEKLQNVTFPKLKILKIRCSEHRCVMKFLENNGKCLEEFHILDVNNNSLNLSIARFCPNLKKLLVVATDDELDTLKIILDSCKYLESIEIWDKMKYLSVKKIFEIVAEYSPENFWELKILYELKPSSEDFESFFISWKNRASKKSLTLIITTYCFHYYGNHLDEESIKVIEKYKSLGIIKKFEFYYKKDEIRTEFIYLYSLL